MIRLFSARLGSGDVDRVTDFSSADLNRFDDGAFRALTPGALAATAFKDLTTGAIDASDRILYEAACSTTPTAAGAARRLCSLCWKDGRVWMRGILRWCERLTRSN